MTPENQNSDAPIRSSIEIAMSGQRPMETGNTVIEPASTPIQSALEKAMNGERPPITQNAYDPSIAPTLGSYESHGASSTPVDLNKYTETVSPDVSVVKKNWENGFSNTPSIVVATEKSGPKIESLPPKEKTLHEKEMETYEKDHNDGYTAKTFGGRNSLSSQDTLASLAKENALLMERLDKMQATLDKLASNSTLVAPYEQDPALAAALDPNRVRPINPLEQAHAPLIKDINAKQADFAKQVQEEDRLHNPLNPQYVPPVIPATTPEITPVPTETTQTPETRRKLKVAYIAGAVIGGSTGVLGGVQAAGIGALVCIAGGLLNTGLNKLSGSGIERWNRRLATVTDPAERTKLEKRVKSLEKIKNFTETTAKDFLRGARHGLLASSIFSGVFLGAHGLAWNTPEPIIPTAPNPTAPAPETGGAGGGAEGPIEPNFEGNSFIKDGRINLPGDAIDGQMAGAPDQNITGNPALDSYGGPSQVGGYQLDVDLEANRIPDDVWNQMPQIDQHRIYNQYWEAAKAGNFNPDLAQELQKLGSEGAKKVLQFMGK